MKKLLMILSGMILASCCSTPIPSQAKLPLPQKLVYPKIQPNEVQCLADETYQKLNLRRSMCEQRIETLRNIIKKTH